MRPEEHAAAGELTVEAYLRPPAADDVPRDFGDYLDELRDVGARARDALVLVACRDQEMLGCVTYVATPQSLYAEFHDPEAAGIRMLAVAPSARGRGVGAALVQECIARARSEDKRRVILHTTLWMHAAHSLYSGFGFERRQRLDMDLPEVCLVAFVLEL
ncbi:MAG: GNAT family N-acetyltransferase [Actinomycetota bacterium]|nr:GNAT family N-acetyltransferase [Actinomycetota bacterium]